MLCLSQWESGAERAAAVVMRRSVQSAASAGAGGDARRSACGAEKERAPRPTTAVARQPPALVARHRPLLPLPAVADAASPRAPTTAARRTSEAGELFLAPGL